jgi:hypothetical protein
MFMRLHWSNNFLTSWKFGMNAMPLEVILPLAFLNFRSV